MIPLNTQELHCRQELAPWNTEELCLVLTSMPYKSSLFHIIHIEIVNANRTGR